MEPDNENITYTRNASGNNSGLKNCIIKTKGERQYVLYEEKKKTMEYPDLLHAAAVRHTADRFSQAHSGTFNWKVSYGFHTGSV